MSWSLARRRLHSRPTYGFLAVRSQSTASNAKSQSLHVNDVMDTTTAELAPDHYAVHVVEAFAMTAPALPLRDVLIVLDLIRLTMLLVLPVLKLNMVSFTALHTLKNRLFARPAHEPTRRHMEDKRPEEMTLE